MTKTRKQRGCGIIGDIGDFLKSHKVLSKAGKMLTPLASAWNPGAGVAVAGVTASLDQAGWGKQKTKISIGVFLWLVPATVAF